MTFLSAQITVTVTKIVISFMMMRTSTVKTTIKRLKLEEKSVHSIYNSHSKLNMDFTSSKHNITKIYSSKIGLCL